MDKKLTSYSFNVQVSLKKAIVMSLLIAITMSVNINLSFSQFRESSKGDL